jgi:hypothetical protein
MKRSEHSPTINPYQVPVQKSARNYHTSTGQGYVFQDGVKSQD